MNNKLSKYNSKQVNESNLMTEALRKPNELTQPVVDDQKESNSESQIQAELVTTPKKTRYSNLFTITTILIR